jgi:hypothetical protein
VADEFEKRGCKEYGLEMFNRNVDGYDLFSLDAATLQEMGFTQEHSDKFLHTTHLSLNHYKADEARDLL